MRLRRTDDDAPAVAPGTEVAARVAWDGIPARPAHEPVIKAPRAGDLVRHDDAPRRAA